MGTKPLAAALGLAILLLGGCSLTIDPDSVKPPDPGNPCVPACAGVACGNQDGCGGTCQPGSGCVTGTAGHRVEGGITHGAAQAANPGGHQVRGAVDLGAAAPEPSNANHRIEQGSLR